VLVPAAVILGSRCDLGLRYLENRYRYAYILFSTESKVSITCTLSKHAKSSETSITSLRVIGAASSFVFKFFRQCHLLRAACLNGVCAYLLRYKRCVSTRMPDRSNSSDSLHFGHSWSFVQPSSHIAHLVLSPPESTKKICEARGLSNRILQVSILS
jgi:hypothetical protein